MQRINSVKSGTNEDGKDMGNFFSVNGRLKIRWRFLAKITDDRFVLSLVRFD